jgi:hypothetical protein
VSLLAFHQAGNIAQQPDGVADGAHHHLPIANPIGPNTTAVTAATIA